MLQQTKKNTENAGIPWGFYHKRECWAIARQEKLYDH